MRVAYNWLKELVNFELTPKELADQLTMLGLDVEGLEPYPDWSQGVIVGEIIQDLPHPQSDYLRVIRVDVGQGNILQIVTGAPNVAVGRKVAVATAGTILPGNRVIEAASFRGVESQGMVCSAEELNLDPATRPEAERGGIMILPADVPLGARVAQLLDLEDTILEIDLTPNRADCQGVINVAREVAALVGAQVKLPPVLSEQAGLERKLPVRVEIKDADLCPRYVARVIQEVKIGPSPAWLAERLTSYGIRPINNIVDVTNYVMLEYNQPLHAFDYDTLTGGHIIVRRAYPGEKMVTLDHVERDLDQDMLLITDPQGAIAVAGVMGGLNTEVTEGTRTVLLESAYFNPTSIRRTSRQLGLRSEASMRFERGIDPLGQVEAINRAAWLIEHIGAGKAQQGVIDVCPQPIPRLELELRVERANQILGTDIPAEEVRNMLSRLGLECRFRREGVLAVSVPSYRRDIEREIDLIEEVGRLYGYHRIPTTLPVASALAAQRSRSQSLRRQCRQLLIAAGLYEVNTLSFISPTAFDRMRLPRDDRRRQGLRLANPLREEASMMRTTLLPGLLAVAERNATRGMQDIAVFEMGTVFWPTPAKDALPDEKLQVALLACGTAHRGWAWGGVERDFYFLKGVVEALLGSLGIEGVRFVPFRDGCLLHPGRACQVKINDQAVGFLGELHPEVAANYELKERVVVGELDWENLEAHAAEVKRYLPLPRFPGVERDLAVVVPETVPAEAVQECVRQVAGKFLESVGVFDVYRGAQIPAGHKSLALGMVYRHPERTFTDAEVDQIEEAIIKELEERLGAKLRKADGL